MLQRMGSKPCVLDAVRMMDKNLTRMFSLGPRMGFPCKGYTNHLGSFLEDILLHLELDMFFAIISSIHHDGINARDLRSIPGTLERKERTPACDQLDIIAQLHWRESKIRYPVATGTEHTLGPAQRSNTSFIVIRYRLLNPIIWSSAIVKQASFSVSYLFTMQTVFVQVRIAFSSPIFIDVPHLDNLALAEIPGGVHVLPPQLETLPRIRRPT